MLLWKVKWSHFKAMRDLCVCCFSPSRWDDDNQKPAHIWTCRTKLCQLFKYHLPGSYTGYLLRPCSAWLSDPVCTALYNVHTSKWRHLWNTNENIPLRRNANGISSTTPGLYSMEAYSENTCSRFGILSLVNKLRLILNNWDPPIVFGCTLHKGSDIMNQSIHLYVCWNVIYYSTINLHIWSPIRSNWSSPLKDTCLK